MRATWTPHNITVLHFGCPQWRHEQDGRQLELTVRSPFENLCSNIGHSMLQAWPNEQCSICGAAV